MTYRADIDGLRALAILLVVIFHFELLPFGKPGFIGVDVFFVISGFLITRIIHADLKTGTFSLSEFYLKRLRRLYPALLATLVLYLGAGYFLFLPDLYQQLSEQILLSLAYVVNVYFWQTVNYFGFAAKEVPLLHMWSLAVEEQFYLFFPLAAMLVFRWLRVAMVPLLVLAMVLSFALGTYFATTKPELAFYMLPTRAWEMLAGSVLAVVVPAGFRMGTAGAGALGLAGLAAILSALVLHTPATQVPGWFTLLPVSGTLALLLAGTAPVAPTTRFFSTGLLVWVGRISYPLYLVHWPILILIRYSTEGFTYGWKLSGLALSVVLAWAIYRFVERPIRTRLPIRPAGPVLWRLGGGSLVIGLAAALTLAGSGLSGRFSPEVAAVLALRDDRPDDYQACAYRSGIATKCAIGAETAPPTIFVFGDSHALHYAPAFDLWLQEDGTAGELIFAHNCMPVVRTVAARCHDYVEEVLDYVDATASITTVYLLSIWRQPFEEDGLMVDGVWRAGADGMAAFEVALAETVARLRAAGKEVVLVDPLFAAPRNVPLTLAKNLAFGRDWPIDRDLADHEADFAGIFATFERMEAAGARRMSLLDDLCDGAICRSVQNGRPIFADNNHLAASAAPAVAGMLARAAARRRDTP